MSCRQILSEDFQSSQSCGGQGYQGEAKPLPPPSGPWELEYSG